MEWQPIETAPKDGEIIVLIGVTSGNGFTGGNPYKTDPWCGWHDGKKWMRWAHNWGPTHWCALPKENPSAPVQS